MSETINKPVSEMTTKELEQFLKQKKEKERKAHEREREKYERERDDLIEHLMDEAQEIAGIIHRFKAKCHTVMEQQAKKLNEYGKMPGNSKGGFSITNNDGTLRVVRTRSTQPFWDERSTKAVKLIREFLHDTVKKRDQKIFEILISFIQKNEKGDLEYDRVMNLLKHEDKFTDPRWQEGLRLIKESYRVNLRGYGYEFKKKGPAGKWEPLNLSFTSL